MKNTGKYQKDTLVTGKNKAGNLVTGLYFAQGRVFPETHIIAVEGNAVVVVGEVKVVTQ